jgi:hypothetical protein
MLDPEQFGERRRTLSSLAERFAAEGDNETLVPSTNVRERSRE